MSFFLWLLLDFLFSHGFQHFGYGVPRCVFVFILLEVCWASWIHGIMFSAKLGRFWPLFPCMVFLPYSLAAPSGLLMHRLMHRSCCLATHSRVLVWRIPGTAEPGGLPSMGSPRVGHDWSDLAAWNTKTLFIFPPYLFIFVSQFR